MPRRLCVTPSRSRRFTDMRSLVVVSLGLLVALAGGIVSSVETLRRDADKLAVTEFQAQEALLVRLAAERFEDLLSRLRLALRAMPAPSDPIAPPARWLQAFEAELEGTLAFVHDADGRVHAIPPALDAATARALLTHRHTGTLCDECLRDTHAVSVSVPLPGHPGMFLAAAVPAARLYEKLFASLSGAHAAYVWVLRADGTIVGAPDVTLVGTRPFQNLPGPARETLGPILEHMAAGGSGTGEYAWDGATGGGRLVAYQPVPGLEKHTVAYSADRASVVEHTAQLHHQARRALFLLLAAVTGVIALVSVMARRHLRRERAARARAEADHLRYRAALDQASDVLLEVDPASTRVLAQNRAAAAAFGDVVGHALADLHAETEGRSVERLLATAAQASVEPKRLVMRSSGGGGMPVSARATRVTAPTGETFVMWSAHDLTARERAQERSARLERLSTIGMLTSSIAHELRNPLAFLSANLEYACEMVGTMGELPEVLAEMRIGLDRVGAISAALGRAGRISAVPEALDLRGPVETALLLAGPRMRGRVELVTELVEPLPVTGQAGELTQVVLNLLVNAAQACAAGEEAGRIRVRGESSPSRVVVVVEDNGPGIPIEVQPRLFEPFFTTKVEGEGTGLGLAISRDIVLRHGGSLTFVTRPGQTLFRLALPTAAAA